MTTLPYPEGLTTRQIIIKGASSLEGGQALVRKALFEASSSLVWLPTGWVFEQVDRLVVSPLGSDFAVPIPVTDLNMKWGVADRPGSVIDTSAPNAHSHSYRVTVSTWDDTETVRLAIRVYDDVFIPTGDLSAITLESMVPVESVEGRVVLIPDMWSEQVAIAVAAAGSADDAAASAQVAQAAEIAAVAAGGKPTLILNEGDAIPANTLVGTLIARKSETVVATNLATNPSFEATSGTVEVWRNLAASPRIHTPGVYTGGYSNNEALAVIEKGVALPVPTPDGITTGVRGHKVAGTESQASITTYNTDGLGDTAPARVVGAWFYSTGPGYRLRNPIGGANQWSVIPDLPVNTWVWATLFVPANTFAGVSTENIAASAEDYAYVTGITVWAGTTPPQFFHDGSYSPDPDLTPSWIGTANASASILTGSGFGPTANPGRSVVASTLWANSGTRSLRIVPQPDGGNGAPGWVTVSGLVIGQLYTITATMRIASTTPGSAQIYARRISVGTGTDAMSTQSPPITGTYKHNRTFIATATMLTMRFGGDTSEVYWDDVQVVSGNTESPFFSGDTPDDAKYRYDWTGTPNASTSTRTRIDNYIEVLDTLPSTTKRLSGGFALPDHKHADLSPLVHTHTRSQITDFMTIIGAGRPDVAGTMTTDVAAQVAAATSGFKFVSTDGPQGAWEWWKRGSTWVVTDGNTGWRNLAANVVNGWQVQTFRVARIGSMVWVQIYGLTGIATWADVCPVPTGHRPTAAVYAMGRENFATGAPVFFVTNANYFGAGLGQTKMIGGTWDKATYAMSCETSYITHDAWPTALSGTTA